MPKCPHCKADIDHVIIHQNCVETGVLDENSKEIRVTHCTDREWDPAPEDGICPECGASILLSEDSSFDY